MGDVKKLGVTLTPANAEQGVVYWSSSDASVATVDGNGTVTAVKNGKVAITATMGDLSSSILLTVNYVAPARFKDVPKSHQFYTDIEWLADSGIT
ncbi:Ig-like domain-containing protein, partial [uncultured Bifidobacterium sp.]|uniref:Ig-like domain-containing protein n=1 Tax=uncultured Bifidobacterium sp. TaxID=165187 RepID=UPI00338F19ED